MYFFHLRERLLQYPSKCRLTKNVQIQKTKVPTMYFNLTQRISWYRGCDTTEWLFPGKTIRCWLMISLWMQKEEQLLNIVLYQGETSCTSAPKNLWSCGTRVDWLISSMSNSSVSPLWKQHPKLWRVTWEKILESDVWHYSTAYRVIVEVHVQE